MIISWNWLKDYVNLDMPVEELTARLTMAGLNLESVEPAGDDLAIDLEVTSNRPDCLGHIGVAREAAVLFGRDLLAPPALPRAAGEKTATATSVVIECEDLCPHYSARVIRGVRVGPSPNWLRRRLETLGIASINNVVDVTNYVLMECGQPLHAFDFDKLRSRRIVVRRARAGEKIIAIDQREYALDPQMCIIADAERAVAIGGVMGGLETEIGDRTANVLIETADFAPLSIRNTARKLNLHSDSSYRFERGVDRENQDWASRRCCELILDVASGELLDGPVVAGKPSRGPRPSIVLRFGQLKRLLGIDVPADGAVRILTALGLKPADMAQAASLPSGKPATAGEPGSKAGSIGHEAAFIPPSWRRDLEREADLIEEVARIYGYDQIPADVPVPLVPSARTRRDRVTDRVRDVLTAAGFFEAITLSFVSRELFELFTPRGESRPITVEHSSRRHENILRQSLVPSLLASRRENERHGVTNAELFEVARVYLAAAPGRPEREVEPTMVGLVTGRSFGEVKGVLETLLRVLNREAAVSVRPASVPQFAAGRGAELLLDGQPWGWLGELDRAATDRLDLRDAATVAEFDLAALDAIADLTPRSQPLPQFPAIERDLNFVLDESVTWEQLAAVVRSTAGTLLESLGFGGSYRGQQIPAGKKSYVVTFSYRAADRTLTGEEVDASQKAVIGACEKELGAALR